MESNKNSSNRPTYDANEVLARAFQFIRVVRTAPEVFKMLAPYGFTPKAMSEGWTLLFKVARLDDDSGLARGVDAVSAIREIDDWDETGFERARIALRRLHPAQESYVFRNLEAVRGPQAVVGMKVLLDRLDELDSSPERTSTRTEDQAALATLAERGIDAAERARLRALVDAATGAPDPVELMALATEPNAEDVAALAAWFEDWSSTAKLVVKRRDILFRLGLIKRRRPKATDAVTAPVAPSPVTPAPMVPSAAPVATPASNGSNGAPVTPPASPVPFA